MVEKAKDIHETLRKKLFLSSMMGTTDGSFCSERGEGCAMVQLGAYLAEPPAYGKRKLVLPPDEKQCINFFADECKQARKNSKVSVCLNLATPELEWGLNASDCFYKAGGDIVEINIHGGYEPYLRFGKLKAMVLPENRPELFKWLEAFSKIDIPVIAKFREGVIPDYSSVLDKVAELNLFGVHFNIRDEETKKPDIEFVRNIKKRYSMSCALCSSTRQVEKALMSTKHTNFLLVSGYVRDSETVRRLFEAGADMVGFAEPAIKDPKFISRIAGQMT